MSRAKYNQLSWALTKVFGRLTPYPNQIKNPTFFIGCGRSGTTWLSNTLATHPQIAVYPTEANELWHPHAYPWHKTTLETPPFWHNPRLFTRLSIESRKPGDDSRLKAHFRIYQLLERGDVFLNKSVMLTFMIPHILALFPSARFIHLVRDGRAVALSYALKEQEKVENYPAYAEKGFGFGLDRLLDSFACHWQEHILEIERQKASSIVSEAGRLLELKYETLCANPAEGLRQIELFLGVSPALTDLDNSNLIKNTNHKYQERLESMQIQRMTELIAPALAMYGYTSS